MKDFSPVNHHSAHSAWSAEWAKSAAGAVPFQVALGVAIAVPDPDQYHLAAVFDGCCNEGITSSLQVQPEALGHIFGITQVVASMAITWSEVK